MRIGIFGATGAVGKELIRVIFDRKLAHASLRLYASERSVGKEVALPGGKKVTIEDANAADFTELDLAFFAIGGGWPKDNARKATDAGCVVIDNSSTFRYESDVPLIIPEINPEAIGDAMLIANPNCTTAIAAIPLFVLYKHFGLKKVFISTYQATSGAGAEGMKELQDETGRVLSGQEASHKVFQHPIAFNLIPHIDVFKDNDYTKEEMKVVWETRKIFSDQSLKISCTCVRVPILRAHSESIVVQTEKPVTPEEFRGLLERAPGVSVKDDPGKNLYPMPLTATGIYDVEVGRIRRSLVFGGKGIEFFVSGDQLLKGAASNAVQIAEEMVRKGRLA